MLILSRRIGESIIIGDDIKVTVLATRGGSARIGIDAPETTTIVREEITPERLAEKALEEEVRAEILRRRQASLGVG